MSVQQHGGAARRTPYEIVFGEEVFEAEHFPAIANEIETRGTGAADPGAFVMFAAVGGLLRALRPPDGEGDPASPDAVLRYGALAFQAFHFHAAGHALYTLSDEVLDHLVRAGPVGDWTFEAPHRAGYLQLPRHRVWVGADAGSPPEPVDGFFWTCGAPGVRERRLDLLLCTGVRPGRPGIGVIDVAAGLPAPPPGHWGDLEARGTGPDFANVLPGGDLDGLHALTNGAEALKLVSRIFRYAQRQPGAVGAPVTAPADAPAESVHAMPPSALPARPIRITDRSDVAP